MPVTRSVACRKDKKEATADWLEDYENNGPNGMKLFHQSKDYLMEVRLHNIPRCPQNAALQMSTSTPNPPTSALRATVCDLGLMGQHAVFAEADCDGYRRGGGDS